MKVISHRTKYFLDNKIMERIKLMIANITLKSFKKSMRNQLRIPVFWLELSNSINFQCQFIYNKKKIIEAIVRKIDTEKYNRILFGILLYHLIIIKILININTEDI